MSASFVFFFLTNDWKKFYDVLTPSLQQQNRSFHVVERMGPIAKYTKLKNAGGKRTTPSKRLFLIVKYGIL